MIRNLNKLDRIPDELREGIFERLFEVAEIARFSPEEVQAYEDSLKSYRDLKNSLDTAFEEGIIGLIKQGKLLDQEIADAFEVKVASVKSIREKIKSER